MKRLTVFIDGETVEDLLRGMEFVRTEIEAGRLDGMFKDNIKSSGFLNTLRITEG